MIKNQTETPLFQIFGGLLRSQICCERCNYKSDTFEQSITLNLPLHVDFSQALHSYFSVDRLQGSNKYKCSRCNSLQNATKRSSITQAPRILIVTIKRFDIFGRKISKRIQYPPTVNLRKYTDEAIDNPKSGTAASD